jgi:hypothetical protein
MSSPHDPKSLGKVEVVDAGTPQPVTANSFMVKGVTFQSDPQNVGTYMYLKDAEGNILFKVTKGQSCTPPIVGVLDLNSLQIDSDTTGDGFYVAYV